MADNSSRQPASRKLPILFIHDAAIDDFVATMVLVAMPNVDLKGIVITDADCIPQPGIDAANRLQQFIGRPDIPLALSEACSWNPFPWPYREDCVKFGELPILLTTGFTPLTNILRVQPALATGIARVVWMGGAINVPGNLDPTTISPVVANKHAEWNVFWDPFAAQDGLDMFSEIHDFPLDITNTVPISKPFMARLKLQGTKCSFSQLAYDAYSLVSAEPFYDMWDVCAAVSLARPNLYAPTPMQLGVVQWGYEQGWLRQTKGANNTQNVYLAFSDLDGFYNYVAAQLARSA